MGRVFRAAVEVQSLVAVPRRGRLPASWGLNFNIKLGVFLWERQLSGCSKRGPSRVGLTEGRILTGTVRLRRSH